MAPKKNASPKAKSAKKSTGKAAPKKKLSDSELEQVSGGSPTAVEVRGVVRPAPTKIEMPGTRGTTTRG